MTLAREELSGVINNFEKKLAIYTIPMLYYRTDVFFQLF